MQGLNVTLQGLNVILRGLNVTLQRLKCDEYGILERKGISRSYFVRREALTGKISKHGMAVATGRLESCLDRWFNRRLSVPDNRRFAQHLAHEQPWIFSFLHCPGLDATNNVAERAIRPAVVARHTWGGNRTATGAATQQILMSVLRTYWQQQKDSFASFVQLLRSRDSQILDIVPTSSPP